MDLPASMDVGTVCVLLKELSDLAKLELKLNPETQIAGAILTIPSVSGLYEEDAVDCLAYLGIIDLSETQVAMDHPQEIGPTYVGYGFGLPAYSGDPELHYGQHLALPLRAVLMVIYSHSCLSITWENLNFTGYARNSRPPLFFYDFGAGHRFGGDGH